MTDEPEQLNFHDDTTIDPANLDIEAVRQAELFYRYSVRSIQARTEMDQKKFALELLEAKLQLRIRNEPEKFGLAKATEASINATVKCRDSYQSAFSEYLGACERAAMLDKACKALEQKKSMIETLCKLHGQQYFAGPTVPHNIVEAWNDRNKIVGERVNERQKAARRATRGAE